MLAWLTREGCLVVVRDLTELGRDKLSLVTLTLSSSLRMAPLSTTHVRWWRRMVREEPG